MNVGSFFAKLCMHGVDFFAGVPDSLLKALGTYVYEHVDSSKHVIAANEGNAIALAAGSYIASSNIPFVYLQNSGLGNTVNPLLSMADSSLYAIPMIVMVGWRGKGGKDDAEQHLVQGPSTIPLIEAMNYPYLILSQDEHQALEQIDAVVESLKSKPQPYFVVVDKGIFDEYPFKNKPQPVSEMNREEVLTRIAQHLSSESFVVTTTGKTSREWYEVRETLGQSHARDFLTVGSMGHTSSIALGMALRTKSQVVCIDGDGSMLMHLGASVVMAQRGLGNFKYILINNFSHESVGGLPTPLDRLNFEQFFKSLGYRHYFMVDNYEGLDQGIENFLASSQSVLELRVAQGSRKDLSRPDKSAGELTVMLRKEFDSLKEEKR